MVVMLTSKRVDSSIVGSKLVWEELGQHFGSERGALCNVRQDIPNECANVHRRRILLHPRRTCSLPGCECTIEDLLSKLICVSRQKESATEAIGDGSTFEGRYMRESWI